MLSIGEILTLYEHKGAARYGGEAVSQLDHALQCAALAENEGAAPELVAAALLHDIGHLVSRAPHDLDSHADDFHQLIAISVLRRTFSDAVLHPIRLHVDAKRYLCAVEPGYRQALSPASQHSLGLQGGALNADEVRRFLDQAEANDAVRLRRWDDRAKVAGLATPPLADFERALRIAAGRARPHVAG